MPSANIIYLTIFALTLTILETAGQTILRKYYLQKNRNILLPFITWIIYGLCVLVLFISYSYTDTAVIEVMWDAGTSIIVPIWTMFFFGEKLSVTGWTGVILSVIGGLMVGLAK